MGKFYKILFALLIVSSFNNIIANNIPPGPEAQISSSFSSVCLNQVATITFSITNGSPQPNSPINYTYTLNGVQGNQFSPNNSDAVTINVNTSIPGTYTYTLINATDSSNPNPINIPISNTSNIVTITVNPLPVVDFTFANNQCSGSAIQFNSVVSGNGPYTYSWNFGDGDTSSQQNPTHTYNSIGCSTVNYNVSLTVTDLNGCSATKTYFVTIKQEPNTNFDDLTNPFSPYSNCQSASVSNPNFTITVSNNSSSTCISSYSIDWGDSSPIANNVSFPISHTYTSLGLFYFTVTSTGQNGCVSRKRYAVKNESNPSGGISSPGSTQNLCAPTSELQFSISNWALNSPGTTYTINYGDNTPIVTLLQTDMMLTSYYNSSNPGASSNYPIPHSYTTSSCPNNSIAATLTVTNSCGETTGTISPISILKKPTANFSNPPTACVNSSVLFTNLTDPGNGLNCSTSTQYIWNFGDGSPIVNTGLISSPQNISHIFTSPGNYTITLTAIGYCGNSVKTQVICIEPPLSPQFTLNTIQGCSPLAVTSTNTTNLTNICPGNPTYQWNVNYTAGYCGSGTPTWSFTNGTSATSANPSFNFVTPGTYNVSVTMTNSCGAITSSVQNIIVKQPPTVTINTIPDYCGSTTINPTANVNSCSPSSSSLSYLWNFPGATTIPAGAINASNPSGIIYSLPGTYTISLTVTNECGSTTSSRTFTIKPLPTATISGDISVCQNATSPTITFTATSNSAPAPNTTNPPYIFTYNINGGSNLTVTSSTATATVSVPTNTVGTFVYNLVSVQYGTSPSCSQSMTGSATVIINPSGQVNQPSNQIVCNNTSTSAVNFATTNTGGTTSYAWSFDTNIGLTPLTGTGNIPSFTAVNTGTTPLTATITVTPTLTNGAAICVGSPKTFTITINPSGQVNQPTNQVVCNNTATTAVNFSTTNTGGTTSYAWSFDTNIGLTPLTGTGNIPSFTAVNTSTTPIVATITVTPTFTNGATNCIGTPKTFTITVNPSGQVNQPTNQVVCSNTTTNAVNFSTTNTNGTTSYAWSINTNIGLSPLTGTGDLPSFTAINTGTTPITATITVTPTYNGTSICNGTSKTFTITVNPSGQVNQPTNQVVCNNTATNAVNFSTTNTVGTTSYAWSFDTNIGLIPLTGSGNIPSFTAVNTGTTPIVATITVTPTFTNGATNCIGTPKTFTITVNPSGQVNPIPNQTLCSNNSTTAINFTTNNTGGITNYNWTNSNTTIGLPASGTGNINAFNVTNSTANPITATITVTPSFSNGTPSCSGPSQTFTITVNPSPAVNFSPTNQTICSGETSALVNLSSTTPGATFSWTATQPTGITGVITSGTNTIPAQNLVNSTNAPITITYVAVAATTGGSTCAGSTYNYTITVNPKPSITESFTEAICSGESFSITPSNSTLNSIPTGTTYSWSAPIVTGGITGGTSATNQTSISGTLVNPTNIVQTATYTVTPRANGCAGNTFTVVISVNPKPVIANVTHPAICSENAFTVTPANGSGNIVPTGTTYTWTINNNTNITGASASSTPGITTISQTLTNTTNTAQTIVYTVTPTSGDTGNCVGSTFTITVVVNPKPFIQNSTQTICSATAFTVTPTNGSGNIVPNTTTYTWTTPVSTPAGAITGGSAQTTGVNTISQTLTNTTTEVATIEYTVTPMAGACAGIPFIITITVNPTPTTLNLTNQTYCNGVSTTEIAFTNVVAGTTYTWTNSNTAIGLAASGTGNIPVFTPTNNGTAPIIATISVIATANGCSRVAETFTIIVNPSPVVTFSPTNQTICSEDTSAVVTLSSTTPGATFSWTATQPTGITGVITSGTNTIPAQNLVNSTNAPITITYVAVAATTGGSTCAGSTYNYTITVNPKPSITESFTEAICSGESFSINPSNSTLNSIPTGTTYSWSAPIVTGGITGGTSATNQTSISGTLVNPTNIVQTATYTVTPRANGCAGNTFTVVISVNPKPVIANVTHPAICSENAFTVTPTNGSGNIVPIGTTYTWTVNNNTNITGASDSNVAGISTISQTLTNSSNTAQTIVYTVTPTSGDTGNCVGDTFTITVVVNPKPFIQNSTQTICSGTAFDATPTNGSGNIVPNTTTYTWTTPVSTPAGAITGGSAQTTGVNTISQTLTNTTTEVATIEYTVTPMAGACAGIPFIITITVNPTPTTLSLTNQTYCNGVSTTEIAFTNVVAGTTYTWTNSNTSIGLAASGTGNIPVFTPTNNGTAPIIATISVIATANGCSRVAETFTIIVNPSPVVTFSPTNQTICSEDTSAVVTLSSTTPGATFSWTATQPTGITGVITSGTNTIPAQNLVNSTNAPIDVNYTAVAATNDTSACAGSSFTYTITVNPKPSIENQSFIICSEEGFTVNPIDGIPNTNTIVPLGTTYNWVISNNPNISGASSGTGSQISQVLTNNSTLIQTIVYTVTPIAGICTGNPFTITIEVYPRPDVTFDLPNQTICNETNTSLVTLNSTLPGNITYEWNATIPTGITGALSSGTNTIPVQTLINTTNAPLTITYAATATFNNNGSSCEGNVYNYSITVNPTFTSSGVVSNYNGYNVSVFGGNDGAINLTTIGGSGTYTYNWTGPNGFTSTAEDISGLFAGTYTVTINDGYCAPIVLTFTLTQPPELLIQPDLSLTINLICFGDNNGAVGVLITQESVPPYDYELYDSNGNLVTSIIDSTNLNPQFTGLVAGVYSLTVIDANGGRKIVTGLTVSQPDDIIITATTTPITCYGANNASITLTVTGGTGPYQAQWDNLATGFYQNNLAAGNYSILVTDNNGCTKTIVVNIPEAPIFTINPVVVNISCYGANDGSINLNLVGGIQPISLTWSDGSTAGLVRNNLAPGTYTVTIVDSKPCTIVRTFIIVEPQPLVLSANVQNALDCNDANSGFINLLVSGGTPPFIYSWSNGATTEDLNTISSGNYAVLVTDSRGCTKSAQYSVNRPQPLTLNVETDTNVNCETRDISQIFEAQVSGGVPPIQLSWSSGTVSGANNEFMTTDQDGLVILTATDAIGCTTTYSLNVDIPVIGNASFDQNSYGYTAYGIYSILDPIQFTNTATGDYVSILWNFGDGTFSNEENPIHTYVLEGNYVVTQTVTYPFGCVYVHTISLLVEKGYLLVVPTAFTPNNDALNDTYRPVTKGLKNVRMDVYDTWGSLIYSETGDVLRGWDGTIKGVNAENGNYHCKVSAETFYGSIIRAEETFVLIK